jgi:hypothetical protein
LIESRLLIGKDIPVGELAITPLVRQVLLKAPFIGFSWIRPEGFQISAQDGSFEIHRVRDYSRLAQAALTIMIVIPCWLIFRAWGASD